jgi:hypothetical protein
MTTMKRIIYPTPEGGVAVIIPAESVELALKDVPEGVPYEIVDASEVPADRTFRGAWVLGDCCIDHDLDKCRAIGHDIRRTKRAEEFAPHDEVIAKQIPGKDAAQAEAKRQEIRDHFAEVQDAIDEAASPFEIKVALGLEEPAPEPEPEPELESED